MSSPFALAATTLGDYYSIINENVNTKFQLKLVAFITTIFIFAFIFSKLTEDGDWNIKGSEMNFRNGFHASIVTLSTVGYGDIVPSSTRARLFSYALILTGFMIAIL